jgi:hypothetical protein
VELGMGLSVAQVRNPYSRHHRTIHEVRHPLTHRGVWLEERASLVSDAPCTCASPVWCWQQMHAGGWMVQATTHHAVPQYNRPLLPQGSRSVPLPVRTTARTTTANRTEIAKFTCKTGA